MYRHAHAGLEVESGNAKCRVRTPKFEQLRPRHFNAAVASRLAVGALDGADFLVLAPGRKLDQVGNEARISNGTDRSGGSVIADQNLRPRTVRRAAQHQQIL